MDAERYLIDHWVKNKIWTHLEWPKHQERLGRCATMLDGDTFCDVGCALGHSTEIMSRFKKGAWHGIEFWNGAVERAQILFPDIPFYYCDNETFDMGEAINIKGTAGQGFDGTVCSEVIEHCETPVLLVKHLWEITKKKMVLTTPCIHVNDPGHLRVYTKPMLVKMLEKAGVEHYKIELIHPFWYITGIRA